MAIMAIRKVHMEAARAAAAVVARKQNRGSTTPHGKWVSAKGQSTDWVRSGATMRPIFMAPIFGLFITAHRTKLPGLY